MPKAFKEYDRDADGLISEQEMEESMREIVHVMCMESARTDRECFARGTAMARSKNLLQLLDSDDDNLLSKSEYMWLFRQMDLD